MKLPKSGRIHHRSLQEQLFRNGSSIYSSRLKLVWNSLDADRLRKNFRDSVPPGIGPVQLLVSVPKKRRKRAVDRVLLRRRIREAYRDAYAPLLEKVVAIPSIRTLSVAIIYQADHNILYAEIRENVVKLIEKLIIKLEKKYLRPDSPDECLAKCDSEGDVGAD